MELVASNMIKIRYNIHNYRKQVENAKRVIKQRKKIRAKDKKLLLRLTSKGLKEFPEEESPSFSTP